MKQFQDEYIKNLPDCYNKEKTSNNYKIMQLLKYDDDKFRDVLGELFDSLDLNKARADTLRLYGEMVGQNRGLSTDEQFLILIKTKIARNTCNGTYQSVVDCICRILNCKPSEILLEEHTSPATVVLSNVPLGTIIAAGLTPNQFTKMIESLLPAGIILENSLYNGTFCFAVGEGEASETEGFCQNEGDDTGGYFGVLSGEETDVVLPI